MQQKTALVTVFGMCAAELFKPRALRFVTFFPSNSTVPAGACKVPQCFDNSVCTLTRYRDPDDPPARTGS